MKHGIGRVTESDIMQAANSSCTIFGFNVRLHKKEEMLSRTRNVNAVLLPTVHGLLEEIQAYGREQDNRGEVHEDVAVLAK